MARLTRLVLAISLIAAGCSSTVTEEPAVANTQAANSPTDAVVDEPSAGNLGPALIADFADWASGAEGGGVAYVRDVNGEVEAFAAGEDPQSGDALDVDDRVRVGSISKVLTSVMVLQLVDEGRIDLDEPISTYVSGLEIANDVTVRQLLSHRTGIPNYTESQGFFAVVVANPDRKPLPEDLISFTNGESDFEPGSQFAYSNTNFIIAGMLIESVTETSLADALEAQIAEPLGLTATAFDDGTFDDVAGGYSGLMSSGNSFDQPYTSIAYGSWAAGGLVTTVSELAIVLDAALRSDLISTESRTAMLDGVDTGAEYGLGLAVGSHFGVGHNGSIVGFNSLAEIDLDTGEMIIVVVNNDMRNPDVPAGRLAALLRGE